MAQVKKIDRRTKAWRNKAKKTLKRKPGRPRNVGGEELDRFTSAIAYFADAIDRHTVALKEQTETERAQGADMKAIAQQTLGLLSMVHQAHEPSTPPSRPMAPVVPFQAEPPQPTEP